MFSKISYQSIIGYGLFALLCAVALISPDMAHAQAGGGFQAPTIPGAAVGDDPITAFAKFLAFALKVIVYVLLVGAFVAAAYLAVSSLFSMISERNATGEMIGKLLGGVVGAIAAIWFLTQADSAITQLKGATAQHIEVISPAKDIA